MRITAARQTLRTHHSAQCQNNDGGAGSSMADPGRDLVPGMPRYPSWSCGPCGTAGNWQCRRSCRGCARDPPRSVKDRQREFQRNRGGGQQVQQNKSQTSWRTGDNKSYSHGSHGRWNGGGVGGSGKAARGDGSSTTKADSSYKSYAGATRGRDWASELAELRRANEKLVRQLSTLQANGAKADDEDDRMDDDSDEASAAARYERIRTLENGMGTLAAIFTEESEQYKAAKEELNDLVRQRREAKPLRTQLQHLDRRIEKQRQKAERLQGKADDLKEKLDEIQTELNSTTVELEETNDGISSLEEERKALLLKEAQQRDGGSDSATTTAGASGTSHSADDAWATVVQTIGHRLNQPGANQELGTQVTATVQLLRDLLSQLPPPSTGAPTTTTSTTTAPGAAAAAAPAAAAAAMGTAAVDVNGRRPEGTAAPATPTADSFAPANQWQGRRGHGQSSSSNLSGDAAPRDEPGTTQRERSPRPRPGATRFRPHGHDASAPTGLPTGSAAAATETAPIVNSAAAPVRSATEIGTTSNVTEASEQQTAREAASSAADGTPANMAATDHGEQTDAPTDEEELVESGDEDEDDRIAMDIERAIEQLPENQRRDKMREILAQRRKDPRPRRLKSKKPSGGKKSHK